MTETEVPLRLANGEVLDVMDGEKAFGLEARRADREEKLAGLGDDGEEGDGGPRVMESGEEEVVGRMPVGGDGDPSDFDYLPVNEVDLTPEDVETADLFQGDEEAVEVAEPAPFVAPAPESFPVLRSALRHYHAQKVNPRLVRIDTDDSHDQFVTESAVRELERRLGELEQRVSAHIDDEHAHQHHEVLGAVEAVASLAKAKTAKEAADALPEVPVDLPPFAQGKVKCWKDGDHVVCSMRFQAADGKARTATMAAKPKMNAADVAGALAGCADPITILGVLPDLADVACAKKLVKEVASAARDAHRRVDVFGMTGPLLLPARQPKGSVALAALMDLHQRCEAGDQKACAELEALKRAKKAERVAGLLDESRRRLAEARAERALKSQSGLMRSYAHAAGWI